MLEVTFDRKLVTLGGERPGAKSRERFAGSGNADQEQNRAEK